MYSFQSGTDGSEIIVNFENETISKSALSPNSIPTVTPIDQDEISNLMKLLEEQRLPSIEREYWGMTKDVSDYPVWSLKLYFRDGSAAYYLGEGIDSSQDDGTTMPQEIREIREYLTQWEA